MREAVFVKQNTEKWAEFEKQSTQNPDVLSERFIELTDDLSFARTFYPDSQVTRYLNGLTSQFHRQLYGNKPEKQNRFILFWKEELPTLFYESHRQLLNAFLIFFGACLIGAVSEAYDDTFVRLILGDTYVNQTLENIDKGDPLAIYKSQDQVSMYFAITYNNIRVAFITFVMGITFSIGTAYFLFVNGIMLGAFQYFFFQKGFLLKSVLTIWVHGTLEISAIVIAGCAGLVMGNSLLFSKTFSRSISFQKGAKQGLKIALGLVPIFMTAGFLESFVTRLSLHPLVSGSIIAVSASFIVWYFVIYPIKLNKLRALSFE